MSSSSSSSSAPCGYSSHPDLDTLEDTLLQPKDILKEPENTLLQNEKILLQPEDSTMPGQDYTRSAGRNIHIYIAGDRSTSIGGLILTNGVTNANLYAMIEIFMFFDGDYILRNESGIAIEKDNSRLELGNYYIDSPHPIHINNETPFSRMISQSTGARVQSFRDAVRLRDRQCVITGTEAINADLGDWTGFEAAHIFPLALEELWIDYNYGRWILTPPNGEEIKGGKMNSVQNGLLLRGDIHQRFDKYYISINPDDNYKIVCFNRDAYEIAGKRLDQRFLDNPLRPVDQLLRWHFRQAVLVNMKGAGEPIFEHDFPPGSDMIGSILKGPKAAERMEFELFGRLAAEFDLSQ